MPRKKTRKTTRKPQVEEAVKHEAVKHEAVDHLSHYNRHPSGVEAIDVMEVGFTFNVSSAIGYLWRAAHKGSYIEDLKKAQWHLNREVDRVERELHGR